MLQFELLVNVALVSGFGTMMPEPRMRLSTMSCDTDATYKVTFTGAWTATRHPTGFPISAHFSEYVVVGHGEDFVTWQPDDIASPGVQEIAETGSADALVEELGNVTDVCDYNYTNGVSQDISLTSGCTKIDLIAKLLPSADWFTGLSGLDLCSEEGYWYHDVTVGVMPFSSGTADDDQGLISEITADSTSNPNGYFVNEGTVMPVAYITIEMMSLTPPILGGGGSVMEKFPSEVDCSTPVTYNIGSTDMWTAERHPIDYPSAFNPHFSPFVYATHDASYQMWGNRRNATPGVQQVAETGGTTLIRSELEANNNPNCVNNVGVSPGSTTSMELTEECQLLSTITMLAPSPDWFSGFYNLNLCVGGKWLKNITISTTPWDAGTDCGPTYTSPNCVEETEAFSSIFEFTPNFPNPFVNGEEVQDVLQYTIYMDEA